MVVNKQLFSGNFCLAVAVVVLHTVAFSLVCIRVQGTTPSSVEGVGMLLNFIATLAELPPARESVFRWLAKASAQTLRAEACGQHDVRQK